jgi:hypothetical protein
VHALEPARDLDRKRPRRLVQLRHAPLVPVYRFLVPLKEGQLPPCGRDICVELCDMTADGCEGRLSLLERHQFVLRVGGLRRKTVARDAHLLDLACRASCDVSRRSICSLSWCNRKAASELFDNSEARCQAGELPGEVFDLRAQTDGPRGAGFGFGHACVERVDRRLDSRRGAHEVTGVLGETCELLLFIAQLVQQCARGAICRVERVESRLEGVEFLPALRQGLDLRCGVTRRTLRIIEPILEQTQCGLLLPERVRLRGHGADLRGQSFHLLSKHTYRPFHRRDRGQPPLGIRETSVRGPEPLAESVHFLLSDGQPIEVFLYGVQDFDRVALLLIGLLGQLGAVAVRLRRLRSDLLMQSLQAGQIFFDV